MAIKTFTAGSVLTAADTNTYLANSGLVYVKEQAIGSGVGSVTVTNAFSSTYDTYRIVISTNYGTSDQRIYLRGTGSTSATYRGNFVYMNYSAGTVMGGQFGSANYFDLGLTAAVGRNVSTFDISGIADSTIYTNIQGSTSTQNYNSQFFGVDYSTNASTDLYLVASSGTISGGKITIYGYRKA